MTPSSENANHWDLNVLKHSELGEHIDHLKRTAEPQFHPTMCGQAGDFTFPEINTTGIRRQQAGNYINQGGLSCSVGSDNRGNLTGVNLKIELVGRHYSAKCLREILYIKK